MRPDHGFHPLAVKQVVEETRDTKSFVFDVPSEQRAPFTYAAGQFCTFRVRIGDEELLRCYSMSSAPQTDPDLTVTVKRVPGGRVSNWMNDEVEAGDLLHLTYPAGVFTLRSGTTPLLAFSGGSGITPVISLIKAALVTTHRPVRLLYANRDTDAIIFAEQIDRLREAHGDRFEILHHLDLVDGFVHSDTVIEFVRGETDADFYICGPVPFMDIVEDALALLHVPGQQVFIERFSNASLTRLDAAIAATPASGQTASVVIVLHGQEHSVRYQPGETILETARRAGLRPPFSCEAGSCATCMARLLAGEVNMRVNNALTPEEVEDGWVLTCQGLPVSPTVTLVYEP